MAEDTQNTNVSGDGAWRTELPEALRSHEAFAPYKSKSELWEGVVKLHTDHSATAQKVTDLETKYKDSIPKLPDDASDEEKNIYQMELGRPEEWKDYELPGDGKDAQEWTDYWKQEFFKNGVSKDLAKSLANSFNGQITKLVEAHNNNIKKQIGEASEKLKAELGDKYDSSVELAQRFWDKNSDTKFDESFNAETSANRYSMIKFLLKIAQKTGEDQSPQGGKGGKPGQLNFNDLFPKSPPSPTGK